MEDRKKDHLQLAFKASVKDSEKDNRFSYEPMLSSHTDFSFTPFPFLGKEMNYPFWISSMTGGTEMAGIINKRLATAAGKYGLGMGLGSCRSLLENKNYFNDFCVRPYIGDKQPLYANFGIAQIEKMLDENSIDQIQQIRKDLDADGIIVHINPLQEAFQPEGDLLKRPPIETLTELLEMVESPIIVKEVGQGMGYESLKAVLKLNIAAFEFGAWGGTNFTKLEKMRNKNSIHAFDDFINVGHDAHEMTLMVNQIYEETDINCKQVIISGGIYSVLDAFYLHKICKIPSVIGMGSLFLEYALKSEDDLDLFISEMIEKWKLAEAFLRVK
ncbi:isopentenyl-diphosphate delta-isomerase [Plebeiibacterium sediminum]|uniref:Isopentenyl-diphosphate delta-isomerase n=1 Tax=Plebeiibacterium sediminum TaxID=2992112 RepID=A0AAE3M7I9_9BACT|nr:isopentenyl-diphosphate delta-isomerase [Plebeiobacterium sediminum]MCW3788699.1 isopentenyl-diphosphate delta-isomerase [Plebeiobacterium sediminum]